MLIIQLVIINTNWTIEHELSLHSLDKSLI